MIDFKNIKSLNIGGKAVKNLYIDGRLIWETISKIMKFRLTRSDGLKVDFEILNPLTVCASTGYDSVMPPYRSYFTRTNMISALCDNEQLSVINSACFFRSSLLYVDLKGVLSVGYRAFQDCNLSNIQLSSVEYIGIDAFYNSNKKSIKELPDLYFPNAKTIDIDAFAYRKIPSMYFPKVENLKGSVFYNCILPDIVEFPELRTMDGIWNFAACTGIKALISPKLEVMSERTFTGCNSLLSVYLGKFTNPDKITNLFETNSLEYIRADEATNFDDIILTGSQTFNNLKTIIAPNSDSASLTNAPNVEYLDVSNVRIPQRNVMYCSKSSLKYVNCSSMLSIDYPMFGMIGSYPTSLSNVNLDSLQFIGGNAFRRCDSLSSVSIPNVKVISSDAFVSCDSIVDIECGLVLSVYNNALRSCRGGLNLNLSSANFIGYDIAPNSVVEYVNIDGLSLINEEPRQFTYVKRIDGNGAETIGSRAFYNLDNLLEVNCRNAISIGNYAFYSCDNLSSTYIPNVEYIGQEAFYSCYNLKSVQIPKAEIIGSKAFQECLLLTSVDIQSAKILSSLAFDRCEHLKDIDLQNVLSIGTYCFRNCFLFTNVSSENLIYAGTRAFMGCENLTDANFQLLTSIPSYFMQNCTSLTSITIPNLLSSILGNAFRYCSALKEIHLIDKSTGRQVTEMIPCNSSSFTGCSDVSVYVPSSLKASFEANTYWKKFIDNNGFKIIGVD